jgi:ubiquinone/menaquinone biosynthesis C-methylase UbiE
MYPRIMKHPPELTAEEQTAMLADRYSQRAQAYDELWSPVIRPVGERLLDHLPLNMAREVLDVGTGAGALLQSIQRAAPGAKVLGVDRSQGMLRLAEEKHKGPLALMDVQNLALPANQFDVTVVAFVLFHLPDPGRCLNEVIRVLKPGGAVGTVTWGAETLPPANTIWNEELEAAGARVLELPATDNRGCCDSIQKMTALLYQAGFVSVEVWTESIEHRWRPDVHFEYHVRSYSRLPLQSLSADEREACLRKIRERLSGSDDERYLYRGQVVIATASKGLIPE